MSPEKLNDVLMLISDLYPGRAPAITERVINVWMKCFEAYSDDIVEQAVMDAVKECKYPPTINDLVVICEKYKTEYNHLVGDIREAYKEIIDLCDRNENRPDTWDAFRNSIKHEDLRESARRAHKMRLRFSMLYRAREYGTQLPPLKDWIEEQEWE